MNRFGKVPVIAGAVVLVSVALLTARPTAQIPGERPRLTQHINQADIDAGRYSLADLFFAGKFLFETSFNRLDGFGRPGSTGDGNPTRRTPDQPFMTRVSGPDANNCAGCHNKPEVGGSGDFVANVFVLAQLADPVQTSIDSQFSNERNTLGMHGSGAIEMLAREMTAELHRIREDTRQRAIKSGQFVTSELIAKGVHFGRITCSPSGDVDTSQVEGVDRDLIIRPFHQKGVVVSVRQFTVNAFNHHHGLQAVERFGVERTGTRDFDGDGVEDELTAGDITAATLFQVALGNPIQVMPSDLAARARVLRGEQLFNEIGCARCHIPALILDNPVYTEPNPYNPPGNLRVQDVPRPFAFDLTRDGPGPHLERTRDGKAIVRAFTDLKRHRIADEDDPFFHNERVIQGGVPTDVFMTRKLWDVGNSEPYGHRGDLSTIGEAIMHHAGEARPERTRFLNLPPQDQLALVDFLKTLQVVPPPRSALGFR
ncbi:MAG: di-heme oxidoredictase family protein [Armatimonadota bacterium]